MTKILPANHEVPLPKALPILQLPLPGGIVTADVSHCGNGGAGEVASGGWVGNQEREQLRMRAAGRMMISVMGEGGVDYGKGGWATKRPGAMTPRWPSNRLNIFPSTSETLLLSHRPGSACFAALGCTNPHFSSGEGIWLWFERCGIIC